MLSMLVRMVARKLIGRGMNAAMKGRGGKGRGMNPKAQQAMRIARKARRF
ncbi:MAG: hypothetical protein ACU0CI_07745 [Shimia sp.]